MPRGDRGSSRGEGRSPRANPNCHECRGLGVVRSTEPMGLGLFLGPYGSHGRQCPSCFPQAEVSAPKPAPRSKTSRTNLSLIDQIIALADLHEAGVLTDEEFELAKKKLLNS